jgi:hypothetical protein
VIGELTVTEAAIAPLKMFGRPPKVAGPGLLIKCRGPPQLNDVACASVLPTKVPGEPIGTKPIVPFTTAAEAEPAQAASANAPIAIRLSRLSLSSATCRRRSMSAARARHTPRIGEDRTRKFTQPLPHCVNH